MFGSSLMNFPGILKRCFKFMFEYLVIGSYFFDKYLVLVDLQKWRIQRGLMSQGLRAASIGIKITNSRSMHIHVDMYMHVMYNKIRQMLQY